MPFLLLNQHRQSTEGSLALYIDVLIIVCEIMKVGSCQQDNEFLCRYITNICLQHNLATVTIIVSALVKVGFEGWSRTCECVARVCNVGMVKGLGLSTEAESCLVLGVQRRCKICPFSVIFANC